jgi:hypothetical protein
MDTPVLVTLIGAGGAVLAAVVTVVFTYILRPKAPDVDRNTDCSGPVDGAACEHHLRRDARVQRLLNNGNWKDTAEAAIAYFSRGSECPVERWKKTVTWQQVKAVVDELCAKSG